MGPHFHWPHARLVVELDGDATHATGAAFEEDRARDRRLQRAGYRVLRITDRQLHTERKRWPASFEVP